MTKKPTLQDNIKVMEGLIDILQKRIKESDDLEHIKKLEEHIKSHKTLF